MPENLEPYLEQYRQFEAQHPNLAALGWALLYLLALAAAILLVRALLRWLGSLLGRTRWVREGVRFRTWEVLPAEAARRRIDAFFRFLFVLARIALFVGYIVLALSLFPQTERAAGAMAALIGERLADIGRGMLNYLPNLIYIGIVIYLAAQATRLLKACMQQIEEGKLAFQVFPPEYATPTRQILTFFIVVFAMVLIAPYLPGSGSSAFQAVTLFVGVLVSLGSSTAVANLIASFVLQYMRAFRVGDTVEVGGHTGTVSQVELFSTRIRTPDNEEIAIPNSVVLTSAMKNYSRSDHVAVRAALSIGYDVPWTKVHEALLEAARRDEEILAEPAPFVLQKSLDDYYVSYELHAFTKHVGRLPHVRSKLHAAIRERFEGAGIEILSPAFTELRGTLVRA